MKGYVPGEGAGTLPEDDAEYKDRICNSTQIYFWRQGEIGRQIKNLL